MEKWFRIEKGRNEVTGRCKMFKIKKETPKMLLDEQDNRYHKETFDYRFGVIFFHDFEESCRYSKEIINKEIERHEKIIETLKQRLINIENKSEPDGSFYE